MRIKNEARWIARSIESQLPLLKHLYVFDDHSTDNTREICQSYEKVSVIRSPFDGKLNESADKNYLLDIVETGINPGDWCLFLDGDEMLSAEAQERLPLWLSSPATALSLRVWYLWDRETQKRVDGVYGDFHRESIFRPNGARFGTNGCGGNFHCGNVPWALRQKREVIDAPILHFGYMHREDRVRKYVWYNKQDPGNKTEDHYRHMVIGDIFPAEAKFMHGGPLKLAELNA